MVTKDAVEEILNKNVRPRLAMDGGDIEVVDVKENKVYVKLTGACGGCPGAAMTLYYLVRQTLQDELPEVEDVLSM